MNILSKHTGAQKTVEFIDHLARLAQEIPPDQMLNDAAGSYIAKEYLEGIVQSARELIAHREWLTGLENTLENLYEVDFRMDAEILASAEAALKLAATASSQMELISLLRK
jgi:hypothetical protein